MLKSVQEIRRAGDVVTLLVSNFGDPVTGVAASRVQLSINGNTAPVFIVAPYTTFQIQIIMPVEIPCTDAVTIYLDGRISAQGAIFVCR